MHKGGSFSVQLRQDGKPLANAAVGCIATGSKRVFAQTDAEGRVSFSLPTEGAVLFYAVQLRWQEPEWFSNFSTLCLQVAP